MLYKSFILYEIYVLGLQMFILTI